MKKLLCFALSLFLITCFSSAVICDDIDRLSEMTDSDIVDFINDCNIELPTYLSSLRDEEINVIRHWITEIENNPDKKFLYNYSKTINFLESLKEAVNGYYGISINEQGFLPMSSNGLLDSTLEFNDWTVRYFNCYSFALKRADCVRDPGEDCGLTFAINTVTPFELALYTQMDLKNVFGYDCVKITTSFPYSLSSDETAICVRKGTDGYVYDYHFMRLYNGYWLHKPGIGAILRYDYIPMYSRPWLHEGISWDGFLERTSLIYDSEIYYIIYKQNHNYSYRFTGNHYHSGKFHYYEYALVCDDCFNTVGNTWESMSCSGPPCYVPFKMINFKQYEN